MVFHVYILFSPTTNKYYIGSCENIDIRLEQHNSGRNKSTKSGAPWQIKKVENFTTHAEAAEREAFIKRMKSRKFTEMVIAGLR